MEQKYIWIKFIVSLVFYSISTHRNLKLELLKIINRKRIFVIEYNQSKIFMLKFLTNPNNILFVTFHYGIGLSNLIKLTNLIELELGFCVIDDDGV